VYACPFSRARDATYLFHEWSVMSLNVAGSIACWLRVVRVRVNDFRVDGESRCSVPSYLLVCVKVIPV
jgi:hypothetical protein